MLYIRAESFSLLKVFREMVAFFCECEVPVNITTAGVITKLCRLETLCTLCSGRTLGRFRQCNTPKTAIVYGPTKFLFCWSQYARLLSSHVSCRNTLAWDDRPILSVLASSHPECYIIYAWRERQNIVFPAHCHKAVCRVIPANGLFGHQLLKWVPVTSI